MVDSRWQIVRFVIPAEAGTFKCDWILNQVHNDIKGVIYG